MSFEKAVHTEKSIKLIHCANCGATNRLDSAKLVQKSQPICGKCRRLLQIATHPLTITDANFSTIVEKSSLPVLLDLWAPWCGPCRILTPVIEQLATELAGNIKVAKLNIDENPLTTARFDIRSIPTLLIFKNGQVVDSIIGAQSKQAILHKLRSIC